MGTRTCTVLPQKREGQGRARARRRPPNDQGNDRERPGRGPPRPTGRAWKAPPGEAQENETRATRDGKPLNPHPTPPPPLCLLFRTSHGDASDYECSRATHGGASDNECSHCGGSASAALAHRSPRPCRRRPAAAIPTCPRPPTRQMPIACIQ